MLRVQEQNLVEMNKTQALHAGQAGKDGHLGPGRARDGRAGPGRASWLARWPAAWPTRRVDASRRVAPFEMTSNVSVRNIGATPRMGCARARLVKHIRFCTIRNNEDGMRGRALRAHPILIANCVNPM